MIKSKKSKDFGEFLMAQNRGQRDLERKSSADERELYNGTASEETKIEQKANKNGENRRFSTF